jgi:aminoglycoside phosphotransferase family enzyme
MSSSIPLREEESIKTKKSRVIRITQSVKFIIYISILCIIIFALLFLQFGRKTKSLWRILCNSQKFRRINPVMLPESVKDRIISPNTQVVFTESRLAERPICVKVWQRQRIKKDVAKQILYLLEGFIYNQRFAPGVYLGIMYLERLSADTQTFLPGHLTVVPHKSKLAHGEYAYVMRALQIDWRLDHRLHSEKEPLATNEGMIFLAKEVARLHRRAGYSFSNRGLPASIVDKLKFNQKFFAEALEELSQDGIDVYAYQEISSVMESAVFSLELNFKQRFDQGHIKRCHGDLKLTNLWIWPASAKFPQRLLALDCIDFNPDFCHIDTLSDVAMLAMDLQMHLLDRPQIHKSEDLVEVFISSYLQEAAEDEASARLLLKYYLTDKAMVCANVSILGDGASEQGRKYLSLALRHAQELQTLLPLPSGQVIHLKEKEVADTAGQSSTH